MRSTARPHPPRLQQTQEIAIEWRIQKPFFTLLYFLSKGAFAFEASREEQSTYGLNTWL